MPISETLYTHRLMVFLFLQLSSFLYIERITKPFKEKIKVFDCSFSFFEEDKEITNLFNNYYGTI